MLSNYLTPTSLYPDILLHWVLPVKVYLSPCPVQSCASQLNMLTPSLISLVDHSLPLVQLPSVPWQPQVFLLLTKNTSAKMSWSESWHLKICWCPCGKTVSLSFQSILLTGPLLFVLSLVACFRKQYSGLFFQVHSDFCHNWDRFLCSQSLHLLPFCVLFQISSLSRIWLQRGRFELGIPARSCAWFLIASGHCCPSWK